MYLIHILLPTSDNQGAAFPADTLQRIQAELVERFGGLTAHSRAPAAGIWKRDGTTENDDIVILEIMTTELNEMWWGQFRLTLQERLGQEEIIIRAQEIRKL